MSELGPDARRILDLAQQARTPEAADQARIEQRLALVLGAGAGLAAGAAASLSAPAQAATTGAAGATVATAATKSWTLWLCGALLAGTGALAGHAALRAEPVEGTRGARLPERVISAPSAAPTELPAAPASPLVPAAAPQPELEAQTSKAQLAPARAAHPRTGGDDLGAEAALLHRAQAALAGGDARRAQRLLTEHRKRFARSALDLERDALQVLTLCELGDRPAASKLARKLLAREPQLPARASLEASCALK